MNYGQARDQVLRLLNQYTVAGVPVPETYNNQKDYLLRIPGLLNDAMMEIATTVRLIGVTVALNTLESTDLGQQIRYTMPQDFYRLRSGDVVRTVEGQVLHTRHYLLQGKSYLLVPKEEAGDFSVTYYRYPTLLPDKPSDTAPLDNTPETHLALPYYAAAMLCAHDEPYLSALLQNKFADRVRAMGPGITAEAAQTADVYGFFGGGGQG